MIYPTNFEQKIGFNEIRVLLSERCLSTLGRSRVDELAMSHDVQKLNTWMNETRELRRLQEAEPDFPLQYFFDLRAPLARLKIEGTHFEEQELFDLCRSLDTLHRIVLFLNRPSGGEISEPIDGDVESASSITFLYPALQRLTVGIVTFPELVRRINGIIDKCGRVKDSASPELQRIRSELAQTEGSISRILNAILRSAQQEGLVDKDVAPAMREGRLVIPIVPGLKRRIGGIVHDESASGRTVYIEPTEVVEANNRVRELEADERREVIRILVELSKEIRPHIPALIASYALLADIDFIRAKAQLALLTQATEPTILPTAQIDWAQAVHPLLRLSLEKQGKRVVPLDICLSPEKRILIISGPNAGGKSVCLKTVALLQYMLQCGLSVPMSECSQVGIFEHLMLDIGDEQSIENDLSTYSSHLLNMKQMLRHSDRRTLLLIDEFGTGTEPLIGGAIAQAVLTQFCRRGAFGIITTHYQNLKRFADTHPGVANGAMLYDRQGMRPLFQLSIGQPGSSFAIEIARKTGLPEEVIREASLLAGEDYIQSDKYLQDIVRDKRYWEGKRQDIHRREKNLQTLIDRYETDLKEISQTRREILSRAKSEAEALLRESNRRIETTIREIRESQAEKEQTKRMRQELATFRDALEQTDDASGDELIARKMEQIRQRKQRHEKRLAEKAERQQQAEQKNRASEEQPTEQSLPTTLRPGDAVRMRGLTTVGRVESIDGGGQATVVFGSMRTKTTVDRLERVAPTAASTPLRSALSSSTRQAIDERRNRFRQDLDIRGERGDEALNAVMHFIDDALLVGMPRVRILHGKGNGILRQLIRQYLSTLPAVSSFRDEHVQFGGAGITVVDL